MSYFTFLFNFCAYSSISGYLLDFQHIPIWARYGQRAPSPHVANACRTPRCGCGVPDGVENDLRPWVIRRHAPVMKGLRQGLQSGQEDDPRFCLHLCWVWWKSIWKDIGQSRNGRWRAGMRPAWSVTPPSIYVAIGNRSKPARKRGNWENVWTKESQNKFSTLSWSNSYGI